MSSSSTTLVNHRQSIIERVRRLGNSSSDAILDPQCNYFTIPHMDAVIGYKKAGSCAVVYGDPVCHEMDMPVFASAFHDFCKLAKLKIIYVGASDKFAQWAIKNVCKALIEWGNELILDPRNDPRKYTGEMGHVTRRKVKLAVKQGAIVTEYRYEDLLIEKEIDSIGDAWLKGRAGPQIHISHLDLFADREGKRWFYARQGNNYVGMAQLTQIKAKNGWLLSYLIQTPEAPNGTSELLLVSVLEILAQENCHYLTLGSTVNKELGTIVGLGNFSSRLARILFRFADNFFNLSGRTKFWQKFGPYTEPTFLLFSREKIGISELWAMSKAMNVKLSSN